MQSLPVGVGKAVRTSFVNLERGGRNHLSGSLAANFKGDDLIVIPVYDERGNIDFCKVGAKISGRECRDAFVGCTMSTCHGLQPKRVAETLRNVTMPVVAEEWAVR